MWPCGGLPVSVSSAPESLLKTFAAFSEARGECYVRAPIAIEWAGLAPSIHTRARRLGVVIQCSRYLHAEDARHEIPPNVFGTEHRPRPVPYILTPTEIRLLVDAASQSGYRTLRRHTYSTLFCVAGLHGIASLRGHSAAIHDITSDGLVIRKTKFCKSRLVPLHETARAGLDRYLQRRIPYAPGDDHVFVSIRRKPLLLGDVNSAFQTAARAIGLPDKPKRARPTSHSLRHTFAVRALQACPDGRDAITRHMIALSTYLGHVNVANTYWYLEAVPELMNDIAEKCERFVMGGRP